MKIIAAVCALLPSLAMAATDSQFGLGLGTQYGGLAGFKYSVDLGSSKLYAGAGLAGQGTSSMGREYGFSLGWEAALTDRHALGLVVRTKRPQDNEVALSPAPYGRYKVRYESFIGPSYTYYFRGSDQEGFLTGFTAGKSYLSSNRDQEFKSGLDYGFHLGYQF
ncbi:hypothetical protein [Microbulbifer yueqingensis]|uniref:Outer membrane protein beta-barrel domain-containing protein n=1 Tax=Microbulbifer yueqingensis TaxID=658219 RepID=A0A1G8UNB8_9GAMM|nr:hypothetical protein [Microbulbifer yueqingensis]SDJ54480.1 hypothetical protein SAMN05216212_0175 [Microbulbifer yueqingensis]